MKNKLFVLPLFCFLLTLSSCEGASTLYGNNNVELDDVEIEHLKTEVLENRRFVSSLDIVTSLEENDVSSTVHLSEELESSHQNTHISVYDNKAVSLESETNTKIISTLTDFTYNEQVSYSEWRWLNSNSKDENNNDVYNLYSYSETSHNNGNISSNYQMDDSEINGSFVNQYWTSYVLTSFFETGTNLGMSFDNLLDVFALDSSYTFITRLDGVIAFTDMTEISQIDNPLHSGQKLTVLHEYSTSIHFTNLEGFGYVFNTIKTFQRSKLLENFDGKYYDNPRVYFELSYDSKFTYSNKLTMLELPFIDTGMSATFSPQINVFNDGETLPTSFITDAINLTSVYQTENKYFTGYVYSLTLKVSDTSLTYCFSTKEDTELEEPIYNHWGYSDINSTYLPFNLLVDASDENNVNHFAFTHVGEYQFILIFDSTYELSKLDVLIISLE